MKKLSMAIGLSLVGLGVVAPAPANAADSATSGTEPVVAPCATEPTVIGGIELGCLTDHLFVFADGHDDANWQASSKGYVGDVAVAGTVAKERTSGSFAYAGLILTDDTSVGKWDRIIDENRSQAAASHGNTDYLASLTDELHKAIGQIQALSVTSGYEQRSPGSLDGLDTADGVDQVVVIDITDDMKVSRQIDITGDAGDVFIMRWDSDADPANGLNGQVKFQSGGAIVPHGELGPHSFIHVAGDINASGGGDTPALPFPQGPRLDNGTGELIEGAKDFDGGGFFTGYWLTTGQPGSGKNSSLSNGIFVGGWYTLSTKFSLTSGTSGVHVAPPAPTVSGGDPGPINL